MSFETRSAVSTETVVLKQHARESINNDVLIEELLEFENRITARNTDYFTSRSSLDSGIIGILFKHKSIRL